MRQTLYIVFGLLMIVSCQKVIDVDLNDANPNIVIEANYTAKDSTVRVKITNTSSYFDSNPSTTVDDAVVTIYDQSGTPSIVPFVSNGEYLLAHYIPTYNSLYTITVAKSGVTYTAQCKMHAPVPLEPITFDSIPPGPFSGDGGYVIFLRYNDPLDTTNYYEIVQSRNGTAYDNLSELLTQDDEITDGNFIERPLFGLFYHTGDLAGIELRSVDKMVYDYILQAQSASDPSQSAPGNPESNWNNDALGYFSAYSSSFQTVTIN